MNETSVTPRPDYVTDVPYERGFIHQLTPAMLRLVAAINGIAPPPNEGFDYLELGPAHGDTLIALAAANPTGRFVGVDVNAEHVAFGNDLAKRSGVTNVRFLERDFASFDASDLPQFDFVSAHGVLSWVSADKRVAVLELARTKLKPGGLLYVSYNALPGWAALEPLRRLMLDASATVEGGTLDRVKVGHGFAQRLADAGAGYMTNHPTVKSMLALIQQAGHAYVAHEYFHAHWHPMYFADVARAMSAHELTFVGQLPLALNVRDLALPPELKEFAKNAKNRVSYETMKDYALNEMFRADVFVKSDAKPAEAVMRTFFEETPFGTTVPKEQVKRTVKLVIYSLDFTGAIYESILAEIARAPATAKELAALPAFAGVDAARIGDCLMNLTLGGEVVPMRRGAPVPASPKVPGTARYRIPVARNQLVLDDVLVGGDSPSLLASTTMGAGIQATLLEMVCLQLVTGVESTGRAGWLRKFSHRETPRLKLGGKPIDNGDELVRLVTRELDLFIAKTLPKWVQLGIVEPVA